MSSNRCVQRIMPSFKAPQYTKTANPKTGAQEPCYTFAVDFQENDFKPSILADSMSDITLQALQKVVTGNVEWWNNFITQFLQASSKLFSKPYTVENINKITKHTLDTSTNVKQFTANVTFVPKNIQIVGGVFIVNWGIEVEPIVIDIPDFGGLEQINNDSDRLPVKNSIVEGMEELDMDNLPVGSNSTGDDLELESPAKFYDKQRVKEARLKAKLALYKAQRQMAMYYDKYGSDVSESESESDISDDEESGDEEVQL